MVVSSLLRSALIILPFPNVSLTHRKPTARHNYLQVRKQPLPRGQSFGSVLFFTKNAGCNIPLLAFIPLTVHNVPEVIYMNKVNSTIKRLRLEKGINQEELADQLHVTRQAVSNWETGVSHS